MYHTEPPTDKTIREWYMNSSRVAAVRCEKNSPSGPIDQFRQSVLAISAPVFSTAVICLPSFPFTRKAVLVKLFVANCLVILYRSREFWRSAAFSAPCAKFSTHVLLSFLAAFLRIFWLPGTVF